MSDGDEVRRDSLAAIRTAAKIRPLLAGKKSGVQGAALADLLATYLAGHVVPGNREATAEAREMLLAAHLVAVRELIPIADDTIIQPRLKRLRQ